MCQKTADCYIIRESFASLGIVSQYARTYTRMPSCIGMYSKFATYSKYAISYAYCEFSLGGASNCSLRGADDGALKTEFCDVLFLFLFSCPLTTPPPPSPNAALIISKHVIIFTCHSQPLTDRCKQ